jgi:peroxiredoxin (alkyl hydroperoxide reductase subunit C)
MHVREMVPDLDGQALLPDGSFGEVTLRDATRWTVVFFYPADFTFVCPTEIRAFAAGHEKFAEAGARILGASIDSVHSHKAWVERDFPGGLPFPLVGDVTRAWARAFGVLDESEGVALRGTFLVDPEGVLRMAHVVDTDVGRSVEEVLRELQAFKSGGLCPAGWTPGQAHVGPGAAEPTH